LVALDNAYEDATSPFAPQWSKGFLVSWSGEKYHVASGRDAYLLYELKDDFERRTVERRPPGWRVSERPPPRAAEMPAQP
jgi:hypothetical protein